MTQRVTDLGRRDPACAAPYHGTMSAYSKRGCRCPHAREAARIYQKRLRENRNAPRRVDATGTARRLQALAALGWRWNDLAESLDVSWQAVQQHATGGNRSVHVDTARRVDRLYRLLCATPGPSPVTRRRAEGKGWVPPLAWDDGDIDNPDARPRWSTVAVDHSQRVDAVAVELVLAGRLPFGRLTEAEQRKVLMEHVSDVPASRLEQQLKVCRRTIQKRRAALALEAVAA